MSRVENQNAKADVFAQALSEVIKHARISRGITVREMSARTGFDTLVIDLLESGAFVAQFSDVEIIAKGLGNGITAGDLLRKSWSLSDLETAKGWAV